MKRTPCSNGVTSAFTFQKQRRIGSVSNAPSPCGASLAQATKKGFLLKNRKPFFVACLPGQPPSAGADLFDNGLDHGRDGVGLGLNVDLKAVVMDRLCGNGTNGGDQHPVKERL